MTPPPATSVTSLPAGLAHGTLENDRWSFSGTVPDRAARIEIQTDTGTTYSAPCEHTHWALALSPGDLPSVLVIQALTMDGTSIAREGCVLEDRTRHRPAGPWWRRRRTRRNWTTYGPGSR